MLTRIWLISAIVVLAIVSLIMMAPLTAGSHLANSIYGGFAVVCHQLPERSYFIFGHKLAVCSRCTGLYAGFARSEEHTSELQSRLHLVFRLLLEKKTEQATPGPAVWS